MSHRYLILGLLMERPLSGYAINKYIQSRLYPLVSASFGNVYPTLHRLLDDRRVRLEIVPQADRPDLKIYHLAESGRQELYAWLRQPTTAHDTRREFLLKLYFARYLDPQEIRVMLMARRGAIETQVQTLTGLAQQTSNLHQNWVIGYLLALHRAEIAWLTGLLEQLATDEDH